MQRHRDLFFLSRMGKINMILKYSKEDLSKTEKSFLVKKCYGAFD